MAALQYVEVPGYHALILRRTFAQLQKPGALLDLSREWLTGRCKWNEQGHRWTFPSGATITFGHVEHLNAIYDYQGANYHFVGYDEATQFTEPMYRYLFSRTRRRSGNTIPIRMRCTANPGGIGHEWVKKRFIAKGCGRWFIPAKIEDNPHLDRLEYVESLAELDPVTRRQLLAGDWNAFASGRLLREWLRYYGRYGTGYTLGGKTIPAEQIAKIFLTVDPAASVKQTASDDPDYTVISAWAMSKDADLIWLGCLRLRVEVPDIVPRIAEMYVRHHAGVVYIEGGGMQKAVAQTARRWNSPRLNVVEMLPVTDKLVRATPALNLAEGGRLWLPSDDPKFPLDDVEDEILRFTGDPKQDGHDDVFDTLSYAGQVCENKIANRTQFVPYVVGA